MQRDSVRLIAGLVLGAVLLAWFLSTIHWPELRAALANVNLVWVAVATGILLLEWVLRTARWHVLLRPVLERPAFRDLFIATLIGGAANTLLPARGGDLARPLVACRRTGAPLPAVIASAVLERLFDLLGLVFVFLMMSMVLPEEPASEEGLVTNLKRYGLLFGSVGLTGIVALIIFARRGDALWEALARRAGEPHEKQSFTQRLFGMARSFGDGLQTMRRNRDIAICGVLSLILWTNGALAVHALFWAFDINLPFGAACFTAVAIALAVVLPQAPGFVGVFHMAIEKTMVLWGLDVTNSKAFAIIFWAVSFLPVTALGLAAIWHEGLSLGALVKQKNAKNKAEAAPL
jgi:uncharacterized protein (TIRG00374 family)